MKELQEMIEGTIAAYPNPRERWQAMKAIRWRLRGPCGEFVGLDGFRCAFVPESESFVFTGQDNEERKIATYQAALGPLTVEVLPCES